MAASFVPTNINWKVIVVLIKRMYEKNIFPMIGDLENSGRGKEQFDALNLSKDKLNKLKHEINCITGTEYMVPQCPAVISSIHINADGNLVADEFSGLSCNWFWLEEPKLKTLLTLNEDTSLELVSEKLLQYRKLRLNNVFEWFKQYKNCNTTFGGCGGDIISLLSFYLDINGGV